METYVFHKMVVVVKIVLLFFFNLVIRVLFKREEHTMFSIPE